jgi:uncharacterized protein (UPF0147 family)
MLDALAMPKVFGTEDEQYDCFATEVLNDESGYDRSFKRMLPKNDDIRPFWKLLKRFIEDETLPLNRRRHALVFISVHRHLFKDITVEVADFISTIVVERIQYLYISAIFTLFILLDMIK